MRLLTVFLWCACALVHAGDAGLFVEEPNLVGKITAGMIAAKEEELTPRISNDGGSLKTSYHLVMVTYLGMLGRGKEHFILATVHFDRSSPSNNPKLPARGHSFLLLLDPKFHLVSHCSLDDTVYLDGVILKNHDGDPDVDMADHSELVRRHGFLIDGNHWLPYPFADKTGDGLNADDLSKQP